MTTILITGTSRGLGLALTKLISADPTTSLIFATARAATPPTALAEVINSSNGKIIYVPLDVSSEENITQAVESVTKHLSSTTHKGLDMLINNAAFQPVEKNFITTKDLTAALHTNVISLHNVTNAFLPLLRSSSTKKIISLSSTLGSVTLAPQFSFAPVPSYKISKAAVNMLNVQYALELGKEGFTCTLVSPGWLRTELGGEQADLSVEEGAKATWEVVRGLKQEKDNGAFRNVYVEGWEAYDGGNPPW